MTNELPTSGDLVDGRYRLLDLIGEGGHGVVYRARREGVNRIVAVKIISRRDADGRDLERLRREVFHASGLTHPNTIEVYDYGMTPDGHLYVAMEYLPGLDLCDWLEEYGPMSVDQATDATLQILESLAEAHRLGIVHRDLKPENIIVQHQPGPSRRLELKLLDFGLSKYVGDEEGTVPSIRVTREDRVYGTPRYMAPEQAVGDRVTPATDIYTVGLIAYEMVDGSPAYPGKSRREVMRAQIEQELPTLPSSLDGTPLKDFIEKSTSKAYEDRFEHAGQAHKWLAARKRQFGELYELLEETVVNYETASLGEESSGGRAEATRRTGADLTLTPSRLSERIAELPLIGRQSEIETCLDWARSTAESGGVLWLSGAPGSGKTRLLAELADRLDAQSYIVLRARFRQTQSTVHALHELLGPLIGEASRDNAASIPDVLGFDLVRDVRRELGIEQESAAPEEMRQTMAGPMFRGIHESLMTVAKARPTLVILDDLHHAGGIAAGFVRRLVGHIEETSNPLGLVLSGRSQEMRANPRIAPLMDDLLEDEGSNIPELELEPLEDDAAEQLLDHVLPLEPPLRESVVRHASGNPLYLAQVVRYLAEHQLLQPSGGQRFGLGKHDFSIDQLVPPSLKGLCLRRLKSLAKRSYTGKAPIRLLVRMALLGSRFEVSLLERMLESESSGLSRFVDSAIETLTELDIVRRTEVSGQPGFAFSDRIFRKAMLESLDLESEHTADLHRLAARTKVRHYGADRHRHLPDRAHEIAQHLERAGDRRRAVDWYFRSATHFETVGDLPAALDDLRSAERLINRERDVSVQSVRRLADIRIRVAQIASRDGRFGPAEDTLRSALEDVDRFGEPKMEAEICRHLGEVLLQRAEFDEARKYFERAGGLFLDNGLREEALRAAIGRTNTYRYEGQNAKAHERFEDLLDRARSFEDPDLESRCLLSLGRSDYANGRLREARVNFDKVFELAEPDSEVYGEALIDCGLVELFRRGPKHALPRLRQALRHSRQRRDLLGQARSHLTLGMVLRRTPDLSEGEHHASRSRALYERAAHRWGIAKAVLLKAEFFWNRGDIERAAQLASDARKLHRDLEDMHGLALSLSYEGLFLNTLGRADEARELLLRALAVGSRSELELYRSRTLLFLGMVEEAENNLDRAKMYYDDARRTSGRQEHLEVELLSAISQAKLELVCGPAGRFADDVREIRERAETCSHHFATLFALTAEAWVQIRTGDQEGLDKTVRRLKRALQHDDGPDLQIPERLFRLSQMLTRQTSVPNARNSLESTARLLRRLDADRLADRLGLQLRTIDKKDFK